MGAITSKSEGHSHAGTEELVDYGSVLPGTLYAYSPHKCDPRIVRKLIVNRRLAPIYKGLDTPPQPVTSETIALATTKRTKDHATKMNALKAVLYSNPTECPICFLFYPSNINYSRCCGQPICTECFLKIKRPTETLYATPKCPFCQEQHYGIVYDPPVWSKKIEALVKSLANTNDNNTKHNTSGVTDSATPRRMAVSHNSPKVVLVAHLYSRGIQRSLTITRTSRQLDAYVSAGQAPLFHSLSPNSRARRASLSVTPSASRIPNTDGSFFDINEYFIAQFDHLSLATRVNQPRSTSYSYNDEMMTTQSRTRTRYEGTELSVGTPGNRVRRDAHKVLR